MSLVSKGGSDHQGEGKRCQNGMIRVKKELYPRLCLDSSARRMQRKALRRNEKHAQESQEKALWNLGH